VLRISISVLAASLREFTRLIAIATLVVASVLVAGAVAVGATDVARPSDAEFLAGLRQRRLLTLAEQYCRDELARSDIDEERRAALTIELSRTLAEQALAAPPAQRGPLWDHARQTCSDYLQRAPQSPRRLLVRLQQALVQLAEGELARQQAEVVGAGEKPFEPARQGLRRAIRELEALQTASTDALRQQRQRGPNPNEPDPLTVDELASLERSVAFYLARARANQALCYGRDSADRINSLSAALEEFSRLATLDVADGIIWQSRLEEIICLRLLGQLDDARVHLEKLLADAPPPPIAARGQAEQIRLALRLGQEDAAVQQAEAASRAADRSAEFVSAELDLAVLEAYLAAHGSAARAGRRSQEDQWQQRSVDQVARIDRRHGPYWMRRAETMLAGRISGRNANSATLRRAAESYYRGGQLQKAIETYDAAARQAADRGDARHALALSLSAAAVENQEGHLDEALRRLRESALRWSDDPRAAEAHRQAIVAATALVRRAPTDRRRQALDRYTALLAEHLARWPTAGSTDQIRLWLGQLHESQREWPQATDAYRAVRPDAKEHEEAVRSAIRSYRTWLGGRADHANQDHKDHNGHATATTDEVARKAVAFLLAEINAAGDQAGVSNDQAAAAVDPLARDCAEAAAEIDLRFADSPKFSRAAGLLTAVLDNLLHDQQASSVALAQVRALLACALAGQNRLDEARTEIAKISADQLRPLMALVSDLGDLVKRKNASSGDAPPVQPRQLAELMLEVIGRIESGSPRLEPTDTRQLASARVTALTLAGRRDEALRTYAELIAAYPQSGDYREARARLLMDTSDAAELREALGAWRDIQRKSHRGSARWFRARLATAEALLRVGNKEEAARIVRLTRVLYPELGGEATKKDFLRVLNQSE